MSLKIKAVFCILGILFHFVIAIVHGLPAFFLNISALLILFSMDYRVFIEYINKLYNYWLTKNYGIYEVLYDGNCGFCDFYINKFKINNKFVNFYYTPVYDFSLKEINVICLDKKNKVYRGAKAINFICSVYDKKLFIISQIFQKTLFFYLIEILIYKIIAKNRVFISKILKLQSCNLRS
jgi:hypothetical protein